ncbi:ABC transporter ATP-binding protein [Ruegeria marina]|uniref:Branched-chain amino acid transport system ATP-binding protein n=1 Tax=Ruegeria marina TaxID=639004 RepID=A0A1G6TC63_9RHOB|nr:ABC transporter ATP-binding protein [Ruegeria marina]SDD26444.1 branched-chain amino acid transport system ATP-binding protein [Ruegeria marina]
MAAALEISGLTRRFGGVTALAGVDLSLLPGEVLGLIGPNGSGKTSLFNVLSGHYAPDAGAVRLDGRDIAGWAPRRIARAGVTRSFQNLRLLKRLSLYENLRAATHSAASGRELFWQSRAAKRRERSQLMDLLALFGLEDKADDAPGALTLVEMRQLEIARLLAARPRLVLLDEPAAGMTPAETARISRIIAEHVLPGRSVIVIEHKMPLITALCRRIAVLQAGVKIADGPARAVLDDPLVRQSYFGSRPC